MSAHRLEILNWSNPQTLREKAIEDAIIRYCQDRDIRFEYEVHPDSDDTSVLIVHISAKKSQELLDYMKAIQNRDLPK